MQLFGLNMISLVGKHLKSVMLCNFFRIGIT